MKTRIAVFGFFLIFALSARSASASAITADGNWLQFVFNVGGPAVACSGLCIPTTNPVALEAAVPPWTFSGSATVTVLDLFLSLDTFELFDSLVSLGISSAPTNGGGCGGDIGCALADLSYSRLVVDLDPGAHSLTIRNVAGAAAGGSAVFQVASLAPQVDSPAVVPEPASLLLLASGLAGAAVRRRRRFLWRGRP